MTLLNEADAIYLGATAADRVYLGSALVWPPLVGWTKTALLVGMSGPVIVCPGDSRQANVDGVMVNI